MEDEPDDLVPSLSWADVGLGVDEPELDVSDSCPDDELEMGDSESALSELLL